MIQSFFTVKRKLLLRTRWRQMRQLSKPLGVMAALSHMYHELRNDPGGGGYSIRPRSVIHPVHVRAKSSDRKVFEQVFIEQAYAPCARFRDVRLVLDCGANVGYSSAYFLSAFPACKLIAVEPDPGNFVALSRNLREYGDRVSLVQAGVWSHSVQLRMSGDQFRDGGEWARQVTACKGGERGDVAGVDIGSLLASSGEERVSLLKMDIEGAEAIVFREKYESWLQKVDAIAIELHDDSSFGKGSQVFFSAVSSQEFDISRFGETTICLRRGSRYGFGHATRGVSP